MSPTQTSCPATGTGRAAVTASLAPGSHRNVVYIVNEFSGQDPTFGTLKRLDVTSGVKTEILKLPNTIISEAQLSADGQWILFVALANNQAKLQLVRMDGQGLQTLYCEPTLSNGSNTTSTINHAQWSTDQKLVAFESLATSGNAINLLNMQSGNVALEMVEPKSSVNYYPVTWLDTTRLFVRGLNADGPSFTIYLLDTTKGSHQSVNNLLLSYDASSGCNCGDFDSSYNGKLMYIAIYATDPNPNGPGVSSIHGPSTLRAQTPQGNAPSNIFTYANGAITTLRAVAPTTLLALVENSAYTGGNVDTSHNGLWKLDTNSKRFTQLASDGAGVSGGPSVLNQYSQYPWSNVSRDSALYALQHNSGNNTVSLLYGSLNGGAPTTFASLSDGTQLSVVGWTTM